MLRLTGEPPTPPFIGLFPNAWICPGRALGPDAAAGLGDPSGVVGLAGLPLGLSVVPVGALLDPQPIVDVLLLTGRLSTCRD